NGAMHIVFIKLAAIPESPASVASLPQLLNTMTVRLSCNCHLKILFFIQNRPISLRQPCSQPPPSRSHQIICGFPFQHGNIQTLPALPELVPAARLLSRESRMNTTQLFEWLLPRMRVIRLIMMPILIMMVAGVGLLVYLSGGVRFAYLHAMYLTILLAGFLFGLRGGLLISLAGGLTIGPFMPIDTNTGEMQDTLNWVYRTGFFMVVGAFGGIVSDNVRRYLRHLKWMARHDACTRLPNRIALLETLARLSREPSSRSRFVLSVISLQSTMELKTAFGFDVIEDIIRQSVARQTDILPPHTRIYRIDAEQIGILLEERGQDLNSLLARLIESVRQPFDFNGIPVNADSLNAYVRRDHSMSPTTALKPTEPAPVPEHEQSHVLVAYRPHITTMSRENLAMLGSLMEAMHQGQLVMHYQPKIDNATGHVHS